MNISVSIIIIYIMIILADYRALNIDKSSFMDIHEYNCCVSTSCILQARVARLLAMSAYDYPILGWS